MAERVKSTCVICKGTDSHPKHHPDREPHHFDCGSSLGCEACDTMLRASGGRHGEELTRFMESRVQPSGV